MADIFGFQYSLTPQPGLVIIDGYLPCPDGYGDLATDVMPLQVKSVTRNSTGNYTVLLTQTWAKLYPHVDVIGADAVSGLIASVILVSNSVSTNLGFNQFTIVVNTAGTPADVPVGGGLQLIIHAFQVSAQ